MPTTHDPIAKREIQELASAVNQEDFLNFLHFCAAALRRGDSVETIWQSYHKKDHNPGK